MNNNHDREKALLKLKSTYFDKNNKKKSIKSWKGLSWIIMIRIIRKYGISVRLSLLEKWDFLFIEFFPFTFTQILLLQMIKAHDWGKAKGMPHSRNQG